MKVRGNTFFKFADRYLGIPMVWLIGLFVSRNRMVAVEPRRIAVIKLSAMGDTILLIPALRALRKRYPTARITAVGTKINEAVYASCPYVDDIVIIDTLALVRNPFKIFNIFKLRYDLALDFDQWLRLSPLLAMLSGAPRRIGFKTSGQGRHYSYTDIVLHRKDRHEVECFLSMLEPLGIRGAATQLEYWISVTDEAHASAELEQFGLTKESAYVLFHPETPIHGGQRHWPVESYVKLGKQLLCETGFRVVVGGTKQEFASNKQIAADVGDGAVALPPMSLQEYAAVIKRARVFVCGNTGVMHLACAAGTSVIALHGPTDPVKWGPWSKQAITIKSALPCSPCLYLGFEYGCTENQCMRAIEVEDVMKAVREIVA